ncbi:uncharacterized phosphotransferase YvkC-like [Patiria miniata]|uniref:Phosphoenolpyruvate synthase n=1 Tax=Patiria miniata TaxID=46514 RepID=A0A914AVQ5_PATMI|nr:uncharacterized phosphotransferase YvkC-like [Patiria miniata]
MDLFSLFVSLLPLLVYILARYASPRPSPGEPPRSLWFPVKYLWLRWVLFWSRRRYLHLHRRVTSHDRMVAKAREISRLEYGGTTVGRQPRDYTSLYINGSDATGNHCLVVRVTLRSDDRREVCFLLRVPEVGDLVLPRHPACLMEGRVNGDEFTGEGLKCTVLEPLRTWRISYNGLCRVGIRRSDGELDDRPLVHVRCTLLWSAFTSYFDFTTDVNPRLAAENLAKRMRNGEVLDNLDEANRQSHHYEQFGMIHGVVQVKGQEEKTIVMRGVKSHSSGMRGQWERAESHIINYMVLEDGTCLHVGAYCEQDSSTFSGYMTKPNGAIFPAVSVDLPVRKHLQNNNQPPKMFSFSVQFENNFTVEIQAEVGERIHLEVDREKRVRVCEALTSYRANGVHGRGVCQTMIRSDEHCYAVSDQNTFKIYKEPENLSEADLAAWVLPLVAPSCRVSSLTGGKGSQLAMLIELKKHREVEFEVPNGFCITTTAFDRHLQMNEELQAAVKTLSEVSCGIQDGDLKTSCDSTVAVFSKAELADDMKTAISRQFQELFGSPQEGQSYAVRSSAVGEDTPQMSAAGQMETYLGMNTMEKIFKAVQECWASQFSFQAVQYRRQYGQPVESTMAVVVQEIVLAKSAGVIFSRDPITGNPAQIVINANFGLGESVVAGVSEADTITLEVDSKKGLTISEKKIGRKEEAIFIAEQGGTKVTSLPSSESASCAVSDDTCLKLGRIALMLDDSFGDARDIEYAVVGESVYLLQARAITTLDVPSRYELLHEFDTGLPTDRNLVSTGNIQEMCPGSVTPLTLNHFFYECDLSFQLDHIPLGRPLILPNVRTIYSFYNQGFFNLTDLVRFATRASMFSTQEMGPSICGQDLDAKDLAESERIVSDHTAVSRWQRHLNTLKYIQKFFVSRKCQEELAERVLQTLTKHWTTAHEQYDDIMANMNSDMGLAWMHHVHESGKSAVSRRIIMEILKGASKDVNADGETAMLLSSCPGVVSADVPLAIERVARAIVQEGMGESFRDMAPEQALAWIQSSSSGSAGAAFAEFLKVHGHRCIKEIELREKSWGMEPIQTIPVVQAILKSGSLSTSTEKKYLSVEEAVDRLTVPLSKIMRLLMVRFFVPRARESVANRERSKSLCIRLNHHKKEAFWRLAGLMVKEGRLPDDDLLFFLTPSEIGHLLKDRTPALVSRALRRRRILPEQASYRFPLIFNGIPKPISEEEESDEAEIQLQGLPISPGTVKSTARVVTSLQDAPSIQQGDVLVTRITDIGWSPYFPLIKGLVTEIGGIMSHGAVVAREYGLPCVVNVQRATVVFKSGDIVLLDGGKGTINKIQATD